MTKILYFAWLREKIGTAEDNITIPAAITTIPALIDHLAARSPAHAAAFANRKTIRCAIDQEFATADTPITGAAEIAFFPPVTGG